MRPPPVEPSAYSSRYAAAPARESGLGCVLGRPCSSPTAHRCCSHRPRAAAARRLQSERAVQPSLARGPPPSPPLHRRRYRSVLDQDGATSPILPGNFLQCTRLLPACPTFFLCDPLYEPCDSLLKHPAESAFPPHPLVLRDVCCPPGRIPHDRLRLGREHIDGAGANPRPPQIQRSSAPVLAALACRGEPKR